MNNALNGTPRFFTEAFGVALGMGGPVFLGAGAGAAFVFAFTRSGPKTLWTWTLLILVALVVASVGSARMMRD